ncbi:MAG TPA: hypothetical protein VM737_02785 [Gemmatimonadota bacterium]|nr:hypothetical protein [Gemmatimonadota bacterium]
MNEILPGVFHWTTQHEKWGIDIHSYYLTDADGGVLIDPRVPEEGVEWFRRHGEPHDILLTNRHHYRHSGELAGAYGATVRCHRAGMHEFTSGEEVEPFAAGDDFPNGFLAIEIGVLCPEETAFHTVREAGILAIGDAVIREGDLRFVSDEYMGEDPEGVKAGLRESLGRLVEEHDFRHVLLAHGEPIVGGGREALARFVGKRKETAGS